MEQNHHYYLTRMTEELTERKNVVDYLTTMRDQPWDHSIVGCINIVPIFYCTEMEYNIRGKHHVQKTYCSGVSEWNTHLSIQKLVLKSMKKKNEIGKYETEQYKYAAKMRILITAYFHITHHIEQHFSHFTPCFIQT